MISEDFARQLEASKTLPSPPGVATGIINLANDPHADIDRIAEVLSSDPATTARVLRIANSPMYAMSREVGNLSQALMILGLNATISLALSFSLLESWQDETGSSGLDYSRYWRRALIAATSTRAIAGKLGWRDGEEMFLAALIQDIGVMALDRIMPELYAGLDGRQIRQSTLIERERQITDADHSEVGAWLLERWAFPKTIIRAVAASHDPESADVQGREALFVRAVAFSSLIAELFLDDSANRDFETLAETGKTWLGVDSEGVGALLTEVSGLLPDAESVFETGLLTRQETILLLEEAQEARLIRDVLAHQHADLLEETTRDLQEKAVELERAAERDAMTGLYNRAYLDSYLKQVFDESAISGEPLSIAVADLDKFKEINDTHGHAAGDEVLISIANVLKSSVRKTDVVARYGGEEFILVFPKADFTLVRAICDRITKAIESSRHEVDGHRFSVTISMGLATHNDGKAFDSVLNLVTAADKALYSAKLQGRNRNVAFDSIAKEPAAAG